MRSRGEVEKLFVVGLIWFVLYLYSLFKISKIKTLERVELQFTKLSYLNLLCTQ